MEVTPSCSMRTVKPATAAANHRKVCKRVNAGRSDWIAFHQSIHNAIGLARWVVTTNAVTLGRTMPALNPA